MGDLVYVLEWDYEEVLADLDRLEGCSRSRAGGHYQREALPVRIAGQAGEATELAWVYLAGPAVRARLCESVPVPGGDWLAAPTSRLCGRH